MCVIRVGRCVSFKWEVCALRGVGRNQLDACGEKLYTVKVEDTRSRTRFYTLLTVNCHNPCKTEPDIPHSSGAKHEHSIRVEDHLACGPQSTSAAHSDANGVVVRLLTRDLSTWQGIAKRWTPAACAADGRGP